MRFSVRVLKTLLFEAEQDLKTINQVVDNLTDDDNMTYDDFCALMAYRRKVIEEIESLKADIRAIGIITNWIEERELEDE